MEACDHDQFPDPSNPKIILLACNCFCETCYSEEQRVANGKGCICPECLCSKPLPPMHPMYYPAKDGHLLVKDDQPHGKCEGCGAATYRKGTRGRFPKKCPTCQLKK